MRPRKKLEINFLKNNQNKTYLLFLSGIIVLIVVIFIYVANSMNLDFVKGTKTQKYFFPEGYEVGAWLWIAPDEIDEDQIVNLLQFAKDEGITKIYIDISKQIDIVERSRNYQRDLELFNQSNKNIISEAKNFGIKIEALVGAPDWSRENLSYIPLDIMDYVLTYNKTNPEAKFSGIQFDIEFYNQKDYKKNKHERCLEFLQLVDEIITKAKRNDVLELEQFEIGFAMPYWLEDSKNNLPSVRYQNTTKDFMNHFFSILEEYPYSYVALMAYRNTAEGKNGVINIVSEELNYLRNQNSNIKIIIAQETTKGEGNHTTYMRKGDQELKKTLNHVALKYQEFENLAGFAIHDLPSYKKLVNKKLK
ncbi:MAG: hypothetical protein NZM26_01785 [Patescibacteria group bacterium]|nr:hypothetical protein [Patescibacteria group bacterium]